MNHFSFETENLNSLEEANFFIQKSISAIEELNPDITCEGIEFFIKRQFNPRCGQKQFNSWLGHYKKSSLKKGGADIGFLEIFVEKNLEFITIYSNPL